MLRVLSIDAISSDITRCSVLDNGTMRTVHVTVKRETVDSDVLLWLNFVESEFRSSLGVQPEWVALLRVVGDFLEGIEITVPLDIPDQREPSGT